MHLDRVVLLESLIQWDIIDVSVQTAELLSRNMDMQQYLEYCEARQASFGAFHSPVHFYTSRF